jgi:hypothetical protein
MFNRHRENRTNPELPIVRLTAAERARPAEEQQLDWLNDLCDQIARIARSKHKHTGSFGVYEEGALTRITRQFAHISNVMELEPAEDGWRIRTYVTYGDDGGRPAQQDVVVTEFVSQPATPGKRMRIDLSANGRPSGAILETVELPAMNAGYCEDYTVGLADVLRASGTPDERIIALGGAALAAAKRPLEQ